METYIRALLKLYGIIQTINDVKVARGERVIKQGWMLKRGGTHRGWKRRWFTLSRLTLAYATSPDVRRDTSIVPVARSLTRSLSLLSMRAYVQAAKNKGSIDLLNATVAEGKDQELDSSGQPVGACWEITTSTRTYYLQCESDKQMREWIATLQQHIASKVRLISSS